MSDHPECGFTWTSLSGEKHRCLVHHDPDTPIPTHRCSCGAEKRPGRQYPPGHSERVAARVRQRYSETLEGAKLKNQRWSAEDEQALIVAAVLGLPLEEIATTLGRTTYGVLGKARGMGLSLGPRQATRRHES